MIRHIVLLRWRDTATEQQREAALAKLRALPKAIPYAQSLTCGTDLGLAAGNVDAAVVVDFSDIDAWQRYQNDPAHQGLVREYLAPILAERTAVQFTLPDVQPSR